MYQMTGDDMVVEDRKKDEKGKRNMAVQGHTSIEKDDKRCWLAVLNIEEWECMPAAMAKSTYLPLWRVGWALSCLTMCSLTAQIHHLWSHCAVRKPSHECSYNLHIRSGDRFWMSSRMVGTQDMTYWCFVHTKAWLYTDLHCEVWQCLVCGYICEWAMQSEGQDGHTNSDTYSHYSTWSPILIDWPVDYHPFSLPMPSYY